MATDTFIEEQHTTTQPVRNNELRTAWDFVEHTGRSIFLTGKARTGKTTFLKTVVERSRKRLIVVAPTGVAAINAGGVTIHSFFQLPFSPYVPNATIKSKFDFGREKRRIIASLDLLIIDDFGMVRLEGQIQHDIEQIIDDRYNRKALILASQLPVADWYNVFQSELIAEACLDRLVHKSKRFLLKGESLRKKY